MAKPPSSVRSIRLTDEAWAWLAASAEGRDMTVNGLVAHLVNATRAGLNCSPSPTPPPSQPPPRLLKPVSHTPRRDTYPDWMRPKK